MEDIELLKQQLEREVFARKHAEQLLETRGRQLDEALRELRRLEGGETSAIALKETERLWRFALEGSGDGIWEYDIRKDKAVYYAQYKKMLGYADSDIFDVDSWRSIVHPDDIGPVRAAFHAHLSGESPQLMMEHRLKCKDGVYRYFLLRGVVVEREDDGKATKVIGLLTDINRSKQLELELKDTANRLSALIGNLQAGVVVESEQGRIVLANETICSMFRLSVEPDALIGTPYPYWVAESKAVFRDGAACLQRVHELIEARKPVIGEWVELVNGVVLERDYIPVYIDSEYRGHLWKYVDVTEKVHVQQKLEVQRKFYEDVLNEVPGDIVVFNMDHQYMFINPVAVKDQDLRRWMIGKTDEEYCRYKDKPMSIAEERNAIFNKVLETKSIFSWEERLTAPDGSVTYHIRNMSPVQNEEGDITLVIGYGLDITDRKRIEDQLQINEKRYRDLYNYSQALICTHDLEGNLLAINPSIGHLLGYTNEELVGKNLMDLIPPQDIEKFAPDYLEKVVREGKAKGVFRILTKEGRQVFLLYQNYKVEEGNAEPYIIGFSQDITERIKAEKELRVAQRMTEELAQAKERFLANMSHEIRTPMNGILGVTSLLSKTALSDEQNQYVNLITDSANDLLIIVNDILEIEKIAAGKINLEFIPFLPADRVTATVHAFQYKAKEKGLSLQFRNALPDNLVVEGDPHRLAQVLNNFLSNALKFTESGHITVDARQTDSNDTSVTIEFTVSDSGIGINSERLNDIFDPFVQAASDTARKYGGTGLGLSISKSMIELQGGCIKVNSVLGKGSEFIFSIPYLKGSIPVKTADISADADAHSLNGKRILVAEDVPVNQFLLKHILDAWGVIVEIVGNGLDAVARVREHTYDLVLMDIQMPEMDGTTATGIIRGLEDKSKAGIPIVALTANALKGDNQRYLDAGMSGYISKPYTAEKLQEVIGGFLKEHKEEISKEGINDTPICDLSLIRSISGGNHDFVKEIILLFLETAPADLAQLKEAADEGKWEMVSRIAHKMKSAIDNMGIHSLAGPVRQLEHLAGGQAQPREISPLIGLMDRTLHEAFAELKNTILNNSFL